MSESNQKASKSISRRKVISLTGAGSAIVLSANTTPSTWIKPLVSSVVLPAHAQTSEILPESCLSPATYCEGRGMGSTQVTVSADGTVTVVHPNGTATAMIDQSAGGSYSVTVMSMGGNTITLSGSIPCGETDSIELIEDNGTGPSTLTLTKELCVT